MSEMFHLMTLAPLHLIPVQKVSSLQLIVQFHLTVHLLLRHLLSHLIVKRLVTVSFHAHVSCLDTFVYVVSHKFVTPIYFNSFALCDRISFNHLPDVFPHTCFNSPKQRALSMLPSKKDDEALALMFETHISRILCTHIPFFKTSFEDIVEWHIRHRYYDEMSAKSEVVSADNHTCII